MKTPKEMAKEYYPDKWGRERIAALVQAGKLTAADYEEITGEEYPNE